jgi:diketogulonate reductase-like aldo/keto reductase
LLEILSKRLRISSSGIEVASVIDLTTNLKRIPLMGFGTFEVTSHQIIYNALSVGYRHLDLAENYNNLQHVKQALSLAFAPLTEGGLGIRRQDIWITMKIGASLNNIGAPLCIYTTS